MTWKVLPAISSFVTHAPEWDRLNIELNSGHPMLDSRFIGALLSHFGDGAERLCLHDSGEGIDGALILRPLGAGRWASFLPSQAQIGPLLVRNGRALEGLFLALPGYAWSIDLLAVDPNFSPDWSGFQRPWRSMAHVNTMSVEFPRGFDDYWNTRPKKLVKNLARYRARAEKTLAPARMSLVSAPSDIPAAFGRYAQLESAGWKGKEGTAIRIDDKQGQFYAKVLADFAAAGQAMIAELFLGETLAASRLIVRQNARWIMLKTAYDESLSAVAPGRQLLFDVLREISSVDDDATVEFYTNASRDQAEWATRLRPIVHHQIYRNELFAFMHTLVRGRVTAERTESTPVDAAENTHNPMHILSCEHVDDLPVDARMLLDRENPKNCETSSTWFANLQQTVFRNESGVRYYVSHYDERPTAVLPIRQVQERIVKRIESLGNYYTSLFSPPMARNAGPLDLSRILATAADSFGRAHVMRFEPMDPSSPTHSALLAALRSIGWIPFQFYCFGNWYLSVETDWTEYLHHRTGMLRNTLKRKEKKFIAEGGRYEVFTGGESLEAAIRIYNDVYSRSWKRPEPYPEFVPGLIRWLAQEGKLRLGIAYINNHAVAAQIWFVSDQKASIFKLAYDEDYPESGAGTLLTAHLMRHVIEIDLVSEVDFLIGDDAHKKDWMNHRRERWGVVAYNPRSLVGVTLLAKEVSGRIVRRFLRAGRKGSRA